MAKIERQKNTIEVWNVCECGRILHSISEGKRGKCASCWVKEMPSDTKAAMDKLLAAAFSKTPPSEEEKTKLLDDAMEKLNRDNGQ